MSRGFSEPSPDVDRLAHTVIGAAIEVHRHLGPGLLESIYEKSLAIELELRGIPLKQQHPVPVHYKGRRVGDTRLDFLVDDKLVVEIKAVDALIEVHTAQVLTYLRATSLNLGLLINFNVPVLKDGIKRLILS